MNTIEQLKRIPVLLNYTGPDAPIAWKSSRAPSEDAKSREAMAMEKLKTAVLLQAEAVKHAPAGGIDEQKTRNFLELHLAGRGHLKLVG